MKAPMNAVGTEPAINSPASFILGDPRRQWVSAPTVLLIDAATRSLATAAVGEIPNKTSAGVIRSEERRVGKESRADRAQADINKKGQSTVQNEWKAIAEEESHVRNDYGE